MFVNIDYISNKVHPLRSQQEILAFSHWDNSEVYLQKNFYNCGGRLGKPHWVQELGSSDNRTVTTPRPEGVSKISSYQNLEAEICVRNGTLGSAATPDDTDRETNPNINLLLPSAFLPQFSFATANQHLKTMALYGYCNP